MNILETLMSKPELVNQLAKSFGLDEQKAGSAIQQLVPALSRGLAKNTQSQSGLDSLMNALQNGNHQQYLDNPSSFSDEQTTLDGNAILGHLLGSKDVSRNVAGHAAEQTGIDSSVLRKMLPVVATMVMGSLSKKAQAEGSISSLNNEGGNSMLHAFLDSDKDGSIVDDVIGLAQRFF